METAGIPLRTFAEFFAAFALKSTAGHLTQRSLQSYAVDSSFIASLSAR